tara:strand:- start:950 stop:1792 length:843 start_codon:yes stop_codon:yes gene_type:complete
MFNRMTYERLQNIMEQNLPYRGRKRKEYPWDSRYMGHKYFSKCDDEDSFTIFYYRVPLIKIYGGNIVEFLKDYYGQGERQILNTLHVEGEFRYGYWYKGYSLTQMESRGGCCMAHITDEKAKKYDIYPVRKGMKFDMMTDIPITKYDVLQRKLIDEKHEEVCKKHADDFILFDSVAKAVGEHNVGEHFHELAKDTPREEGEDEIDWVTRAREKSVIDAFAVSSKLGLADRYYWWKTGKYYVNSYEMYLDELYGNFKTKVHPCENKYFPSNQYLKIQMRGE